MRRRYDSDDERYAAYTNNLRERRSTRMHAHNQQELLQRYRCVKAMQVVLPGAAWCVKAMQVVLPMPKSGGHSNSARDLQAHTDPS